MSTFDAVTELFPKLGRYKKAIVTFLGTTAPYVLWLTSSVHSSQEIVATSVGYVLLNFGVYQVENKSVPAKIGSPAAFPVEPTKEQTADGE